MPLAVKNHGVDEDLQAELFEQCGNFFNLPLEEKMQILVDKNNRGYTAYKQETLSPDTQTTGDTKEGLVFGNDIPANHPEASKPFHGPNQWPSEDALPNFKPVLQCYFEACMKLGFRYEHSCSAQYRKRSCKTLPLQSFIPILLAPCFTKPERLPHLHHTRASKTSATQACLCCLMPVCSGQESMLLQLPYGLPTVPPSETLLIREHACTVEH